MLVNQPWTLPHKRCKSAAAEVKAFADRVFASLDALTASLVAKPRLAIGLSGGPDSSALAQIVCDWSKARQAPPPLGLIVDHGVRPEAFGEAQDVRDLWQGRGLECLILKITEFQDQAEQYAAPPSHAAMRQARYSALYHACKTQFCSALVVGHHHDDQIETLFQRLDCGSGLMGLSGIRVQAFWADLSVWRPLLDAPKSACLLYCQHNDIKYVTDPSNTKLLYSRARWRRRSSCLASQAESLQDLAQALRDLQSRRDRAAKNYLEENSRWHFGQAICFNLATLGKLEFASLTAVLSFALSLVGRPSYPPSAADCLALWSNPHKRVTIAGCLVLRQQGQIWVVAEARKQAPVCGLARVSTLEPGQQHALMSLPELAIMPKSIAQLLWVTDHQSSRQICRMQVSIGEQSLSSLIEAYDLVTYAMSLKYIKTRI